MELNDDWLSWPPETIEHFFTSDSTEGLNQETLEEKNHEDA